ncbi:MAG: phosphoribosylglycinamide formyltransferase [Bacteroidota bacterium]|nr:phosphoribosylglycinamide formyltransferase [Bacteroidota bacterium]MDP4213134.1 phosphoribosylglycinamide formyltransferase [Bacteroidota bacterium]
MKEKQISIALLASGKGSNAQQIINYFQQKEHTVAGHPVVVSLIVCNKPDAGVLEIAKKEGIPSLLIEREEFFRGNHYLDELRKRDISFLVLAGFLWKIPSGLIHAFPDRIINIHPALLPAYGGKGMYGLAVHQAVIAAGEKESGISIHFVDDQYDHGKIFFQARCSISKEDTAESLAEKIHALEHDHYPQQIARWIETKLSLNP